ncbi:MAG: hypothetical protein ACP5P9_02030, partial [Acidimicrobiales bacterium]
RAAWAPRGRAAWAPRGRAAWAPRGRAGWAPRGRAAPGDAGGVWIVIGVVGGILLYAGTVLMAVAGFNAILPVVVLPPVVLLLIAGGGFLRNRPPGRDEA